MTFVTKEVNVHCPPLATMFSTEINILSNIKQMPFYVFDLDVFKVYLFLDEKAGHHGDGILVHVHVCV